MPTLIASNLTALLTRFSQLALITKLTADLYVANDYDPLIVRGCRWLLTINLTYASTCAAPIALLPHWLRVPDAGRLVNGRHDAELNEPSVLPLSLFLGRWRQGLQGLERDQNS